MLSQVSFLTGQSQAIARFFVTGGNVEGTSLVKGSGGILPQKIFKFGGFQMLFSALVMRYVVFLKNAVTVIVVLQRDKT